MVESRSMPQALRQKTETYPHKVKTSPQAEVFWDWEASAGMLQASKGQILCNSIPSFAQSTGMTDLILIFAFILGVQYSNPFWVHGHVPPLKGDVHRDTWRGVWDCREKEIAWFEKRSIPHGLINNLIINTLRGKIEMIYLVVSRHLTVMTMGKRPFTPAFVGHE